MNPSASSSTITSTPSSQQSSNQNRPTTTSPPTNGMAPASKSTSIDSLLSTHGGAPSPTLAALEQAVSERNVLSSQNTQLWKLIEKQRTGYNQLLKDLERVRGERDQYKSKFLALGHAEKDKKRDGDREKKSLKHSHSTPLSVNDQGPSVAGESVNPEPKSSSRVALHHVHTSRSQEPMVAQSRNPQSNSLPSSSQSTPVLSLNLESPSLSSQLASTPPSRSHKITPPPLNVPPRSESLPFAPTLFTTSPESGKSENSQSGQGDAGSSWNNPSAVHPTKPLTLTPRKLNTADIVASANAKNVNILNGSTNLNGEGHSSSPSYASMQDWTQTRTPPAQSTPVLPALSLTTPQTAPPGFGFADNSTGRGLLAKSTAQVHPHALQTPGTTPSSQPSTMLPNTTPSRLLHPNPSNDTMLSALNLSGESSQRHVLSRESRISLPDEAKQFIANMQDSPTLSSGMNQSPPTGQSHFANPLPDVNQNHMQNPVQTHFQSSSQGQIQAQPHVQAQQSRTSTMPPRDSRINAEFSPRPSKPSVSLANADLLQVLRDGPAPLPSKPPRSDSAKIRKAHEEFLDFDDDDGMDDEYEEQSVVGKRRPKARAAVEDFPLPPSNAPGHDLSHAHLQSLALQKEQVGNGPTHHSIQPSADTRVSTYTSQEQQSQPVPASFRALPLLSSDLPYTQIHVSHSSVRPNDRGKDVLSFIVVVEPGNGKDGWKVEKLYSDVLGLDSRMRASVGKGVGKKMASLPEGKLWRDHAPAKVDQRKAALETYLQTLINLPVKNKDEVIAFFTSDIVREAKKPVSQVGYKEGYLTKRGKNFGGWKSRFFVLQGPVLEYYESRGGTHLGSILITGSQIGRQQTSGEKPAGDEEKEYRHAFLIVEAKKGPGGNHPRHVLCAESDADRDSWVEILVRYVMGSYNDDPIPALGLGSNTTSEQAAPRSSTSSVATYDNNNPFNNRRPPVRPSRDEVLKGLSLQTGSVGSLSDDIGESSPVKSIDPVPIDRQGPGGLSDAHVARKILERGQQSSNPPDAAQLSSSLPNSSPLDSSLMGVAQRANSELGHYPDMRHRDQSPERHRRRDHHGDSKAFQSTSSAVPSSTSSSANPEARAPSPEKVDGKAKISGPIGGAPIPAGYKFGGKDAALDSSAAANERREKAKSRSFWGFGRPNGGAEKPTQAVVTMTNRMVFGVPLEESLEVVQMATLPAVVFRCIQYLEAKKADQEEGIYRLSGSSAVIKSLKDRFNHEGDVNLLASDEYWDPHAIAGLLKTFLRELPASILTRDLHLKFLSVIDFVDPQERIRELSQLIASLPIANYSLLRALTAHLILIVQNAGVNKMTMRNVGIVFSPTLGIPAGVFSLMLGEFNRVFNVDSDNGLSISGETASQPPDMSRRNSRHYSDAAADQLLGLSGRSLTASVEEVPSDGDDFSVDESGTETTEGENTVESSGRSSPGAQIIVSPSPDTPTVPKSKASHTAATRGLNIDVSERGNRHSRIVGLPSSPRPSANQSPLGSVSPLHTAR